MEKTSLQKIEKLPSQFKILAERFVLAGVITFGIFGIGSSLYEIASTRESLEIESSIKSEELEIKKEEITAILKTYPKSWVKNISSIKQDESEIKKLSYVERRYGQHGYKTLGVTELASFGKYRLIISDALAHLNAEKVIGVLSHEIGHAGFNSELFGKISTRLQSADRFKSDYVESIKNPNKKTETIIKVNEYWAEICKQYFENADKLNPSDRKLVEEQIKKGDYGFDWRKEKSQRDEIVTTAKQKEQQKEQEEKREILGLSNFSVSDEVENGKLVLNFDFTLKGAHFKAELKGNKKFLGQKGTIYNRADGFVYSREIKTDTRESDFLSFFFEPKDNTVIIRETKNMMEVGIAMAI